MIASDDTGSHRSGATLLRRTASAFAVLGGVVLGLLVVLVVASVLGRALFAMPIPGDFEIVAIGTGIAVCLFLPWCYVTRGNVTVDILANHLRPAARRVLDTFAACLFAAVAGLIAWRMILGLVDVFSYGDITMIVGLPLWWAYPFAVCSFALVAVAAAYTAMFGWQGLDDGL